MAYSWHGIGLCLSCLVLVSYHWQVLFLAPPVRGGQCLEVLGLGTCYGRQLAEYLSHGIWDLYRQA